MMVVNDEHDNYNWLTNHNISIHNTLTTTVWIIPKSRLKVIREVLDWRISEMWMTEIP